jgi:hypothetical protein
MSQQEIREQIKQLKAQGKSKEFVRQSLQSVGWADKAIDKALNEEFKSVVTPQTVKQQPKSTYVVQGIPGVSAEQEKYIKGFSGGAFFGGIIWTLMSRLYVWSVLYVVLALIPGATTLIAIYLGFAGRKLSWQKGKWANYQEFKARQELIVKVIFIVIFIGIGLGILYAFLSEGMY